MKKKNFKIKLWAMIIACFAATVLNAQTPNPITGNLSNYQFGTQEDGVSTNYQLAVWSLTGENFTNAKKAGAQLVLKLETAPSKTLTIELKAVNETVYINLQAEK